MSNTSVRQQKELQGLVAFVAFSEIHRKGNSVTKAMISSEIGLHYFGDDDSDSIGLAYQLTHGVRVFGGMFNVVDDSTDQIASANTSVTQLSSCSGKGIGGAGCGGCQLHFKPE